MDFDVMTGACSWDEAAALARDLQANGFSGMLFTETSQVPWMMIAAAARAAPDLHFSTGIAVAFPRSPMMTAQIAWELAANTGGRFRLGLGSQVKAHVTRRYGVGFDRPAPQMRDYVRAVRACLRAFRGEDARLAHDGPYYRLSLLTEQWTPARHEHEDIRIDIAAVGPYMSQVAGEVADGVHVHPVHSIPYIHNRLRPALAKGAARAGRPVGAIDLIVPVFAVAGDSAEARAPLLRRAKTQIGFYGATPNYAFQFTDLGYDGVRERLAAALRRGDTDAMAGEIDDEMFDSFGLAARWDDMADRLIARYRGIASRLVMYVARQSIAEDPRNLGRWGEIARAVRAAA